MSVNLKYAETIELPSKVMASHSFEISKNGYISIATASALYVYEIHPAKDNTLSSLSVKRYNVVPSTFVLSSNVGLNLNLFINELPPDKLYESILSTELSGKLKDGSSVEQKIIKSSWSPRIIDDYDCVLATLSNTGSLEILTKTIDATYYEEFKSIFNLTEKYAEMCRDTWGDTSNMIPLDKYNELKCRIKETLPTAFTWSEKLGTYCILIVAHACGDISFWKVNTFKSKELQQPEIHFMNVINATLVDINIIEWAMAKSDALIFTGNYDGQVNCLKVTNLDKEHVINNGELQIWSEKDQVSVKNITIFTYLNKKYLLFVKGSDLIILLFNEEGNKIDSYVLHAGNVAITGVERIEENSLLIACLTGAVKELVITNENSKINIEWKHFYVNINNYIYQTLNLVFSRNKALVFILTGPCKISDTKEEKHLNTLMVFLNTANDPLEILLNNQTNNLKDYWDCLEVLRYQALLDKQLSLKVSNFEKYCDKLSLYRLKLALWTSKLSGIIYEQTGNVNLNVKSSDDVRQIYNLKMIINRIVYLLKLHEEKINLTEFQFHNIFILNSYLKEIVAEDLVIRLELGEHIVNLLLNVMLKANAVEYPTFPYCLFCGERLISLSCVPPHFDMKCSISFMQIAKYPDYKCLRCGSVVHTELEKEFDIITCPLCDIPMRKRMCVTQ